MKDKEIKFEEIESSHTLHTRCTVTGEGHVQVREKWRGCKCYSDVRLDTLKDQRACVSILLQ
jgi:hypothetical protein